MAQEYKICLSGTATAVAGTENIKTLEAVQAWLDENQVHYEENDPEKPAKDSSKYVFLPIEMSEANA